MTRTLLSLTILTLLVLPAPAEDFSDPEIGLRIAAPEGWDRDTLREGGAIRYAGILDLTPSKQIRFEVSVSSAAGFDPDKWLQSKKAEVATLVSETTQDFTPDRTRAIDDKPAVGYTIAGKITAADGKEHDIRYRVYAIAHGPFFVKFEEASYNGAHEGQEERLEAIWSAISLEEPEPAGVEIGKAGGEPTPIEDKGGNFKLVAPPGWEIAMPPPDDDSRSVRLGLVRTSPDGVGLVDFMVFRYQLPAGMFVTDTPTTTLQRINRQIKLFEPIYGEDSAPKIRIDVLEGERLGSADKVGSYKIKDWSIDEYEEIRKARDLVRRGAKGAKVPEIPKRVTRGYIAMIAPYAYVVRATFRQGMDDNEKLIAEYKKIIESWEFLSTDPMPPPLSVAGKEIGNTKADPALAKERKVRITHSKRGRKEYKCDFLVKIPPGFRRIEEAEQGDLVLLLAAQDERNRWVRIQVIAASHRAVADENKEFPHESKRFEGWKSNWESAAVGSRAGDARRFSIGNVRGKGFRELEGTIDKFKATRTQLLADTKGWRIIIEIDTRGGGEEAFEEELKDFMRRGLRFRAR